MTPESEMHKLAAETASPSARDDVTQTYVPQMMGRSRNESRDEMPPVGEWAGTSTATPQASRGYLPEPTIKQQRAEVNFEMPSLGAIDPLMADDSITDILINGTDGIFIDRRGRLVDSGIRYATQEEVWEVAERIMETINQHWSHDRPMIDTRLPDGSRVNIVGPPIAIDGVTISIRKFPKNHITLDSMVRDAVVSPELGRFLRECIYQRLNIVISGATSSGKTTLLNALSGGIPRDERIVTIEDSAELRLQQPHVVRLEARPPVDGKPAVSMRDLVKNALRMRPDRIILGESRGPEAFDVLQAMNTGHDGSMTTMHANTPRDALARMENMVLLAMPQLSMKVVRQQISSAINLVIQMSRPKDGARYISHITEVCGIEGETLVMQELINYVPEANGRPAHHRWTGGSTRNPNVTEAARLAGMIRQMR